MSNINFNWQNRRNRLRTASQIIISEVNKLAYANKKYTRCYKHDKAGVELKLEEKVSPSRAKIKTVNLDSFQGAARLVHQGFTPVVLNMASERTPGGGWTNGADSQEESLFFRSTLCASLKREYYPLKSTELLYSPHVQVYRSFEDYNKLLANPFDVAVISAAAIRNPVLEYGSLNKRDWAITKIKIRNILATGAYYGHDAIVLGSFGAGAFHNPPEDIAQAFQEVITEGFDKRFKKIWFAVIDRKSKDHNYKVFKQFFP